MCPKSKKGAFVFTNAPLSISISLGVLNSQGTFDIRKLNAGLFL